MYINYFISFSERKKNYTLAQLFVSKETEFDLIQVPVYGHHFSYFRLLNIKENYAPG